MELLYWKSRLYEMNDVIEYTSKETRYDIREVSQTMGGDTDSGFAGPVLFCFTLLAFLDGFCRSKSGSIFADRVLPG